MAVWALGPDIEVEFCLCCVLAVGSWVSDLNSLVGVTSSIKLGETEVPDSQADCEGWLSEHI